jgi:hypothetical protein
MMKSLLLVLAQLAASGSDAYFTDRNMHDKIFKEYDPIAKPFLVNRPSLVASCSLETAAEILMPRILRKHHSKLSNALSLASVSGHTFGAIESSRH